MPPTEDGRDGAAGSTASAPFRMAAAVADLHADPRPERALERLLAHTARLTGFALGAVSVVEADGERYVKAAERGVTCQVGRTFPLDEGATGRAVGMRRPIVVADYALLPAPHLQGRGSTGHRAAVAVPMWWRGEVIGVNVAFRPLGAPFRTAEVDQLEALSQSAATAIAQARRRDPSLGGLLRSRIIETGLAARAVVTETGRVRPVPDAVADAAAELLAALDRAQGGAASGPLQVGVVYQADGVRLLVQQATADAAADAWFDAVRGSAPKLPLAGTVVHLERVPGWGMALRADLLDAPGEAGPLTAREREVLALVRDGLTDRAIAAHLGVSPKTVGKHVGALLRKAGARSRAAAVAVGLQRGWL